MKFKLPKGFYPYTALFIIGITGATNSMAQEANLINLEKYPGLSFSMQMHTIDLNQQALGFEMAADNATRGDCDRAVELLRRYANPDLAKVDTKKGLLIDSAMSVDQADKYTRETAALVRKTSDQAKYVVDKCATP